MWHLVVTLYLIFMAAIAVAAGVHWGSNVRDRQIEAAKRRERARLFHPLTMSERDRKRAIRDASRPKWVRFLRRHFWS